MKKLSLTLMLLTAIMIGTGALSQTRAQSETDTEKPTITITEYSDYQCPACAYFHPIVKKLKEKYGDQIKLTLKFFPLNSHRYGALAARAAQAAKNQGKFHEMHNLLYENQKRWSNSGNPTPIFVQYARDLELDVEEFKNDLNAAETQKTVMEQKKEGRQAGVNSTPTFYIDGEQLNKLPRTYAEFDKIVQQYLNEKK